MSAITWIWLEMDAGASTSVRPRRPANKAQLLIRSAGSLLSAHKAGLRRFIIDLTATFCSKCGLPAVVPHACIIAGHRETSCRKLLFEPRSLRSLGYLRAVACHGRHARHRFMTCIHKLSGIVDVGVFRYAWELRSEPQWSETEGWKGMTIALQRQHTKRGALLEFPPPKRLLKGMQRGRLQISDALVIRGIQAALHAGWEPASRGRPIVFVVDAEGN